MGTDAARASQFLREDHSFVALVDGAFVDAAVRSGAHLLCRPGCTQCCIGAFAIGPADSLRLTEGLVRLKQEDPLRAARVRRRAVDSWTRLAPHFPGDPVSGALALDEASEPPAAFDDFANDEPCPALDTEHGTCDLYAARPHTCRLFGPPVPTGEGYGVCELCFRSATLQEITDAAIEEPPPAYIRALDQAAIEAGASAAPTIIAFVLSHAGA